MVEWARLNKDAYLMVTRREGKKEREAESETETARTQQEVPLKGMSN
jgi:hypothetical protein